MIRARSGPGSQAPGPRTGPGAARAAGGPGESQSRFFHKGIHGLKGAGAGYIRVILSNAQAADASGGGPADRRDGWPGPPAAPGPDRAARAAAGSLPAPGRASVLAGGEARLMNPADSDDDPCFDTPEEETWESDNADEDSEPEDDPGVHDNILCNMKIYRTIL